VTTAASASRSAPSQLGRWPRYGLRRWTTVRLPRPRRSPTRPAVARQARRSSRTLPRRTPHECDDSSVRIEISAVPTWPLASIRAAQWRLDRRHRLWRNPTRPAVARQARRSSRTLPGRTPHACDDSSVRIEICYGRMDKETPMGYKRGRGSVLPLPIPSASGLGTRTLSRLHCECHPWTVPQASSGCTVESVLRCERPNRSTGTCVQGWDTGSGNRRVP